MSAWVSEALSEPGAHKRITPSVNSKHPKWLCRSCNGNSNAGRQEKRELQLLACFFLYAALCLCYVLIAHREDLKVTMWNVALINAVALQRTLWLDLWWMGKGMLFILGFLRSLSFSQFPLLVRELMPTAPTKSKKESWQFFRKFLIVCVVNILVLDFFRNWLF